MQPSINTGISGSAAARVSWRMAAALDRRQPHLAAKRL